MNTSLSTQNQTSSSSRNNSLVVLSFLLLLINMMFNTATMYVLIRSKLFNSRTFALIKIFLINDIVSGIYMPIFAIVSLLNFPLFRIRRNCYYISTLQFFFARNSAVLHLFIAIDRYITLKRTTISEDHFSPSKCLIARISCIFVSSFLLYILGMFDHFDDSQLSTCIARLASGSWMFMANYITVTIPLFLCMFIYVCVLILFFKKMAEVNPAEPSASINSIQQMNMVLFRKMTKILAYILFIWFLFSTLPSAMMTFFASYNIQLLTTVGSICGLTSVLQGSLYFASMILIKDFRQEFIQHILAPCIYCKTLAEAPILTS